MLLILLAFLHHVVVQPAAEREELHVYIEGDGTPFIRGTQVAGDPTPRKPVALRLMKRDRAFSVYVGRPCYWGLAASQNCDPSLWTNKRYSAEVVESMRAAIRKQLNEHGAKRLVLIGHSGGGTLAMLLAPHFEETTAVITIAANLDIDAWADLHGYTRLDGSLNPATQPPLPDRIKQIHLAGGRDRNVPPHLIPNAIVYPRFTHSCCWEREWPQILRRAGVSPAIGRASCPAGCPQPLPPGETPAGLRAGRPPSDLQ